MGSEGYFAWCESMERRQLESDRKCSLCSTKQGDSKKRMKSYFLSATTRHGLRRSFHQLARCSWTKSTDSTQVSKKIRCNRRSRLSNVMQARLGPQTLGIEGKPGTIETLEARLGPSSAAIMSEWPSHPLRQRQVGALTDRAPLGSISR
ncbi:hypothetical protein AAG906_013802 [Vitis piasezkii]